MSESNTLKTVAVLKDYTEVRSSIQNYHPILIEGPGRSDKRDATPIANHIAQSIQHAIKSKNITKPLLLISQGDPIEPGKNAGIATVVNHVLTKLDLKKGLVCLDEHIADYHAKDADRTNVVYEMRYSQMVKIVEQHNPSLPTQIEEKIQNRIKDLNDQRIHEGREKMKNWVVDFALLQEMTKFALKLVSGDVTVAHTMEKEKIDKYSVTSFFKIGLDLDLIQENDMIFYSEK